MSMNFWRKWGLRGKVGGGLLVVLILVVGFGAWYTRFYMTKERRFWTAIENGLRTPSITKETELASPSGTQLQQVRLHLGQQAAVEGKTTITQVTQQTTSTVVTNNISTPTEGFVRYEQIDTNEKNATGEDFDFSSVIGQWAAQDGEEQNDTTQAQVFAESFVQLIPIAFLDAQNRAEVMKQIKDQKAYEVDFSQTREDSENGLTVYSVTLNTQTYVTILQDIFRRQGLAELESLNPDQYDPNNKLSLEVGIDSGNQVRKIGFSDDQFESYNDYGITSGVNLPTNAIPYTELQTRLSDAQ